MSESNISETAEPSVSRARDLLAMARTYEQQLPVVLSVSNFTAHYSRMVSEYEALLDVAEAARYMVEETDIFLNPVRAVEAKLPIAAALRALDTGASGATEKELS